MAKVLVTESYLSAIASAIRSKAGTTQTFTPAQMASAIENLPSGGNPVYRIALERKNELIEGIFSDDEMTIVGSYAFAGWQYLEAVHLGATTLVNDSAFLNCSALTTVDLSACTSIGSHAFESCSAITSLSIPSCKWVGSMAFLANGLGDGIPISSLDLPACSRVYPAAFLSATMLTLNAPALLDIFSGSAPTSTSKANYGAFQNCRSLTTAYLSAIQSIGAAAFYGCHNLISLYILGSQVPTVGNSNAFSSTPILGYSASAGRFGSVFVLPSMYSAFISAAFWSTISSRIVSYAEGGGEVI